MCGACAARWGSRISICTCISIPLYLYLISVSIAALGFVSIFLIELGHIGLSGVLAGSTVPREHDAPSPPLLSVRAQDHVKGMW